MDIKYCLPIIKNSKEEVLGGITKNPDYDFYEIWLSYIEDLDIDFVWKISNQYNGKLIFLFRKQNLEKSGLTSSDKKKIIKLLEASENYLDLDINDQKQDLDFIKENKLSNKLIASYHNYKETPSVDDLKEIADRLDSRFRGNDKEGILKVSTFCKKEEDSIKLLQILLKLKRDGKKYIVLGMGDKGKIVRIYGALWGNEMNFAPINENEKSAPGQITKKDLETIFERIENGR